MTLRTVALLSAAAISLAGCGGQEALSPEQSVQTDASGGSVSSGTSEEDGVSELEVACYDQRLENLTDSEIKSIITSNAGADSLTTDQTVRLARFYQQVAQECFQ